jgi:hypothetical protein
MEFLKFAQKKINQGHGGPIKQGSTRLNFFTEGDEGMTGG